MTELENKLKIAELEQKAMAAKIDKMESKSDQVTHKIVGMEKEIEDGMEKAKKEVKNEMATEMKEREERGENIVVYGVEEAKEEDPEERKRKDNEKMKELAEVIGVEVKGGMEVKFRAGKKKEGEERPRPMIVKVEDEETRQKLLSNARRLARNDDWRRVFVSPDMTYQQREEARNEEKKERKSEGKKKKQRI